MQKQPTVEARSTPIFLNTPEKLRYFYHPDHIGSTSWVTDSAKNGIQYCEYLPYKKLRFFSSLAFGKTNEFVLHSLPASVGEPFLEKRSTTWNSRYTFSGKERDGETGYSYFGARYYNSDISIWLSVDPLSDKYPNLTPYAYCANNPIILVDPDGKEATIPPWVVTAYISAAKIMENYGSNSQIKTIGYAMMHPINAMRVGNADTPFGLSKIASNFEVNLRKGAGFTVGEGKQGNAYRHVLWQAMLTRDLGADEATQIGYIHEDNSNPNLSQRTFGSMSEADQSADLLNNIIGRELSGNNKGASNKELAIDVLNEYKENGLWTVSGNEKDGYTLQKTKLSQNQYNEAIKVINSKGENGLGQ